MSKSELAAAVGVTQETLRCWMKSDREALAALGVSPNAKMLPPKAVKYLAEKYDIDLPKSKG